MGGKFRRLRPSADRKVEDARWKRTKRGWRYAIQDVSEIEFCRRATQEQDGFYNGARVRAQT